MAPKALLTHRVPDIHGNVPNMAWVNSRIRHSGNGKTYVVTGFAWMGATDEWGFVHHEFGVGPGAVLLCRPLSHMNGNRDDGTKRYEAVS